MEKVSSSPKNPGRAYHACGRKGCHFVWVDQLGQQQQQPQQQQQQQQQQHSRPAMGEVVNANLGFAHNPSPTPPGVLELLMECLMAFQQFLQQHREEVDILRRVNASKLGSTNFAAPGQNVGMGGDDELDEH